MRSENGKNLTVAFMLSFAIHATAVGYVVYDINNEEAKLSKDEQSINAFSIAFTQIADKNNKPQAASLILDNISSEISQENAALSSPKEQEASNEPEIKQTDLTPPELPKIQKEIREDEFKNENLPVVKKESKRKTVKKKAPKKPKCNDCKMTDKTDKNPVSSDKINNPQAQPSIQSATIKGENETNIDGGNRSSGEISTKNQGAQSNLQGLIYAALKKHTTYPKEAISKRLQGKVVVKFKLLEKDSFEYIKVIESSGLALLDRHAVLIVKKSYKSIPKEAVGIDITAPIVFDTNEIKGRL